MVNIISKIKYRNIKNIFDELHFVDYATIKGEALSFLEYDELGRRHSGDIDILVPKKKINFVRNILCENGFTSAGISRLEEILTLLHSHQTSPWIKDISPWGVIIIDINHDIFWGEYEGKRVNIEEFLSDTIEIDIYGCKVKTLSPLKTMVQLILHHYKDMNSIFLLATRNSIHYNMFKDVYYLLKNNLNQITIERLYSLSEEYEIIPYVFYVLYYTGKVFYDNILNDYIEAFRTTEGEKLLNHYGLCENERKEWKYDFNTLLETDNLYSFIKDDLTKKDHEKISINKHVFLGESK